MKPLATYEVIKEIHPVRREHNPALILLWTMDDCCNNKACEIEAICNRQNLTLKIMLGINAIMFVVELTAGLIGGSVSLLADSLDMPGDALVYGFSIYVVARGAITELRASNV